jgi:UDP-glucuronate 4-epimerase
MNKVLITGCAGFIGSHLTERLLKDNYQVCGLDNFDPFYPRIEKEKNLAAFRSNKNFEFFELNICSAEDLQKLPGDVSLVVHLASKAGVRPSIKDKMYWTG